MLLSLSAQISYNFNLDALKDWPVSNKSDIKEIDNYRFNENSLEKKRGSSVSQVRKRLQ